MLLENDFERLRADQTPTDRALNKHVFESAMQFAYSSLVYLVPSTENQRPVWIGTGIVIRTPAGNPLVLTAAHNLDDHEQGPDLLSIGFDDRFLENPAISTLRAPEGIDVGLIVPHRQARATLQSRSVHYSRICAPSDAHVSAKQWTIVTGFPAAVAVSEVDHARKVATFNIGAVTHGCIVEGFDEKGRLKIGWDEGVVQAVNPQLPAKAAPVVGVLERLPHPGGMSGGAIWRFDPSSDGEIWSPTSNARLLAVQSAWDKTRTLFAEPASRWGRWLEAAMADVDRLCASEQ